MLRLYLTLKLVVFNCSEVCRLIYFHTLGVGENLKIVEGKVMTILISINPLNELYKTCKIPVDKFFLLRSIKRYFIHMYSSALEPV